MANRQKLIVGVLSHFLQDSAEDFALAICSDAGLDWPNLQTRDLNSFADICKQRILPIVGRSKANFVSGVIHRLQERGA